ncbi:hypothetical protein CA13_73300 [Planctomycetes bacterium CA13]|uniref:DUF4832 domain-containing protein n=1 Tax=Novipirellula herctigrandis TaxID=2527986 RepID=A0A5C5YLR1_9BACT|nr:hypothetical protein CA13_73300 [Planctomycetes bacterium CA13]
MRNVLLCIGIALAMATDAMTTDVMTTDVMGDDDWVTVKPNEFEGAINNPLKGFRGYHSDGYGLLHRQYIGWNSIELSADDTVDRIIARTNEITRHGNKSFGELNIKLVPRVYLDWDGTLGTAKRPKQHWPADMAEFDYDSPEFQQRLKRLIAKLGEAWDNDPRIFAIQMGLIGYWGEHHTPAPTKSQRRLMVDAFKKAFKNKPILVRHTDAEFMDTGFGIYYDTFANVSREPPHGDKHQLPWQATHVYPDIWKHAPIEGEVEYNWQKERKDADPEGTFGRTPDETMTVPAYRRYMIDKIRRYHATYLGWISSYTSADATVLKGAGEVQKAFGYRFVIDSLNYPAKCFPGADLSLRMSVRNTGSAPFYLNWPVAVALLDPVTRKPVWSAPLDGIDVRKWLPGEDWDSEADAYRTTAKQHDARGRTALPVELTPGEYILAIGILDREGGMVPSVRFAIQNYIAGGWHPFGVIGVGATPRDTALKNVAFDSPAFDRTLTYQVPAELLAVQPPPVPKVTPMPRWQPDPKVELINPRRYWELVRRSDTIEKRVSEDGSLDGPDARKVLSVIGDYGRGSNLNYRFFNHGKLDPGHYWFSCRVKGTKGQTVRFDVADGWRGVMKGVNVPLSSEWREHGIEFDVKEAFENETRLRFSLPTDSSGEFHLTEPHLKRMDGK